MAEYQTPLATGLAGGVISAATLEKLVEKKVLTLDEARAILAELVHRPRYEPAAREFSWRYRMIGSVLAGKFAKR